MAEPSPAKIPRLTLNGREGGENHIDRLSSLPECILLIILSFLDLKEAATTTVLAKSWRDLFLQLPNIDLTFPADDNYNTCIRGFHLFSMFANRVLLQRNEDIPISILKIDAQHFVGHFRRDFRSIMSSTAEALSTYKVKELNLNLDAGNNRTVASSIFIPPDMFSSESLTSFRLTFSAGWIIPETVCLPNLRYVEFNPFRLEDENAIQRLLDGCPRLENFMLTIKVAGYYYDEGEEVKTLRMSSSSLKLLMVSWDATDAPEKNIDVKSDSLQSLTLSLKGGHRLKVDTPNLEFFSLSGDVLELNMIQGAASIHEAVLNAEFLSQWEDMEDLYSRSKKATKFFHAMENLRLLSLSETIMKALYVSEMPMPTFQHLHKIKFIPFYCQDFPRHWMIRVFIKLFASCPNLEILSFDWLPKNYFSEDVPLGTIFPLRLVQHIKQMEIRSFNGRVLEYKVLEHFMKNGTSLEIVCVKKFQHENFKKETWKPKERKRILSIRTCSEQCEVLFI